MSAGKELLAELAGGTRPRQLPGGGVELWMQPADYTDRGDEWWPRVCYALALMVELRRTLSLENSRLMGLGNVAVPQIYSIWRTTPR